MLLLVLSLLALPMHGGQYLPPADVAQDQPAGEQPPTLLDDFVSQPGLGPVQVFAAERWEWWFEYNHEGLLRLDERVRARAGDAYVPIDRAVREQVVLPALVDALRDRNRDVRSAAAMALARLGAEAPVPFLELIVESDPDLFVRTQTLVALGVTGNAQVVETLARVYGDADENDEIRAYAAFGLGLVASDHAQAVLLRSIEEKALAEQSNALRAATIHAVGVAGSPALAGALDRLLETWLAEREPSLRALSAVALGRIGTPAALPRMRALLVDEDNQVRRSAANGLLGFGADLDDETVALMLRRVEKDGDVPTRLALIRALGASSSREAREYLRETLASANYLYRSHTALALGLDGHPDNTRVLLTALEDEHEVSVLGSYAVGLGLVGNPHAIGRLRALAASVDDPSLLGYIALALGLLGDDAPPTREWLLELLTERHDVALLRHAAMALGLLGDRAGVRRLAEEFASIGSVVDQASRLHGLGLVGDRTTLPTLLEALAEPTLPAYVRTYAAQALGELCDPRAVVPAWRLSRIADATHDIGVLLEVYSLL